MVNRPSHSTPTRAEDEFLPHFGQSKNNCTPWTENPLWITSFYLAGFVLIVVVGVTLVINSPIAQ